MTDLVRLDPDRRLRSDVLEAAVAQAPALGAVNVPDLPELLETYYANVALEDLTSADPLDLLGAALSHRQTAAHRGPGECVVRVHNPSVDENGWSNQHTCVEIVTDDMPFLVDSVSAALSARQRAIHLVVHPQFAVRRDEAGDLIDLAPVDHDPDAVVPLDAVTESWIHFDIDRESDRAALDHLATDLTEVLADVRAAVLDWPPMLERARELARAMADRPVPGLAPQTQTEAAAFLAWLADGNFTFLGYRRYDLVDTVDGMALAVVPDSGLGILRGGDPTVRPLRSLPEAVRDKALEPDPLVLTKANSRSTVHRNAYLDYVGVKVFDAEGTVVGEDRFLGLYTAAAYNQSVVDIPVLRAKSDAVLERSGFPADSHSGKDVLQFLETYPRDELFQATPDELLGTALGVLGLQERRKTRLFWRRDPYGRFMSCLVYLPRDRYNTTVRQRMESILRTAVGAESIDYRTRVTESVLARLHFVARVPEGQPLPEPDHAVVEAELAAAARSWDDVFAAELVDAAGEEEASRLATRFGSALPESYKEAFPARAGVSDVRHLDRLPGGATELNLYRPYDAGERVRRLKIYRSGESVSLSRILPVLHNLGVDVTDERPFTLVDDTGGQYRLYDLGLVFPDITMPFEESVKERFEDAFLATWRGAAEVDRFNALVLHAGLNWREAALLRALVKYLRQASVPFSQDYIETVLLAHPGIVRDLVDLFHARFEPGRTGDRAAAQAEIRERIVAAIDAISSLDVDLILRFLLTLITSAVRTSYYRPQSDPFQISFKFLPREIDGLPEPRPQFEIWVYSPEVEGVHLRFAPVARGGLRWSDRPEDFRTEILGLVKAQAVKNTVIVPAGAKGGFYAKRLPDLANRDAYNAAGRAAYTRFISGLLDLTDNRVAGEVRPPTDVVRYDGDDPYLVVAADKGTATFSDLANSVSQQYGFWLGDAFASGGSEGYDHKAMGITARGAWESVKRHFRDLGIDTQTEPFTVAGIGDMSGDVFGNGMLLSECLHLVAAFDHRHVFLDPHPDPATSFAERRRLFELPRSSWGDYEPELLSPGGGIYPRSAKAIPVTPEVREALGITDPRDHLTPAEMIREILRARVDLLWNGGIGTYVKATTESQAEVGDKSNDAVRVDGRELRCRVVGEGGNLGFTQRGRIEAARAGVRLNNDAVDNSAGVDTSDHEVNIKILADEVVRSGDLTIKQRNELLHSMTDEVGELVLRHNYDQNTTLGNARAQAAAMLGVHARMMREWVAAGELDRDLEFLPDEEQLRELEAAGAGLTSPELCVLLAYSKMTLAAAVPAEVLAADPYFQPVLQHYFPSELVARYSDRLAGHPLAPEIIRTVVINDLVNRGGISFVFRASEETAAAPLDVVRSYTFGRDIFDLPDLWARVRALDNEVPTTAQGRVYLEARRLLDRTTRWMVQTHSSTWDLTTEVERYRPVVRELSPKLPDLLRGPERQRFDDLTQEHIDEGVPVDLAQSAGLLLYQFQLLDITRIAERTERPPLEVAEIYFTISERWDVDGFLTRISALSRDGRWEALARQALRSDLYSAQASLTAQVVRSTDSDDDATTRVDEWVAANESEVSRVARTLADIGTAEGDNDLASLSVALRALRTLVAQSRG
ncbi:MAG: NAD-glutamate dehydrogenase [Candidatus Nanopelagicales bacterium]